MIGAVVDLRMDGMEKPRGTSTKMVGKDVYFFRIALQSSNMDLDIENRPFICASPFKTFIQRGLSIAMFDYQSVR